jgi:phospholipid/cholesterol/gamma-HCH transport system ATP-binding protein
MAGNDREATYAVVAEEVYKSFDGQPVLCGINLSVETGKTVVIVGASGSGKTVLVSMFVGLMSPDSGVIRVFGEDVTKFTTEAQWNELRMKIGFVFQGAALYDSMTVGANVAFPLRHHLKLSQRELDERVMEKLRLVGLEDAVDKLPSEVSGGMQKRAGLARALALDPDLVIYDEPTAGLDPLRAESVSRHIRQLQKKLGNTAVVVTHDMACAFIVGDHIAFLDEGIIVEQGNVDQLARSSDPRVRKFFTVAECLRGGSEQ